MTIGSLAPKAEKKNSRKNKAVINENAPLIPKTLQKSDVGFDDFNGASFSGAVFNLSTTIIGAGIMALPATLKELGMVPGLLAIILMAFLTEKSIELMIRFSRAGSLASYGGLMGDAFGKYGKALVQICVIINNIGVLIVYMIIIGDVLSGTSSSGDHHSGILEGWFGVHWWTGRAFVLLLTTLVVFAPLASFKRIDSLRFTSALSVGLAVVFLVIAVGIAIVKIFSGGIGMPRIFPIVTDVASFFKLFTVVPVLVTAYICHYNGVKNVEVDLSNQVVRILGSSPVKTMTEALEQTGRKARLIGQGVPEDFLISAAVSEFKGPDIFGVVRLAQVNMELARIEANFSGLSPGKHGWSINEFGDLTRGAASTGKVFNRINEKDAKQPVGDLGTLDADEKGEAFFTGVKEKLRVADLIGRSLVVHATEDKSEPGIAAAVIARSAGVGENYKKLCTCDGTTIWEASDTDFVTSKV